MNIKSKIESLLFISAKPMSVNKLTDLIKKESKEIKKACDELVEDYKKSNQGIQIIKNAAKYQMVSSPENTKLIQEFIKDETTGELSRPSLETLTIIAYRSPVSKIDLDRIRGVNCSLILRNLLLRGLVEVRYDKKKSEDYYSVTLDFIRFLGINDVSELPEYEKLSKDDSVDRMLEEDARVENQKLDCNLVHVDESEVATPQEISKREEGGNLEEIVEGKNEDIQEDGLEVEEEFEEEEDEEEFEEEEDLNEGEDINKDKIKINVKINK
ncbi:SMC-Scp complex subunit ScpB [Candidatus Falkowbacteria bacterium RIFOXYB2_FULL_34_18]|uniref:SMC-Scp complex subunit ScpB n=1 Tax=Candidatus Falkowbacteria bacterium RIFOXYD2_FULL_34_120 TaxID=1798007 RepID=A0A1F5TN08_9BACT|nr:MAG: SMC-Scp complex subunit ScpB [Candidatus Falkowbacteria bacterium RIFOXYB2_FULL_34_18]OGF28517.1 MAG: SMC-Scp complex subunit ScpB [Candidatus Falkowbacteria bacterium RIFOXYC12_FULL_34_55]OGF38146.1 MAG: SMC-Scp complex subunit ScpB [Candidatus Falkowbacteria bacterium RIFOXYC2_FULL_34_220]OGF38535.1 MAG: SMC-Scp complex subunit ScpB [Candidatus Falkowbacteria bacterium RIFOXYD12_FULL_34_57]OGF40214.1 MAG: SMC-Scp complex subunit ScpB [Candidatus Falkowbacteria bacterium RIFOXYD2_FULL_